MPGAAAPFKRLGDAGAGMGGIMGVGHQTDGSRSRHESDAERDPRTHRLSREKAGEDTVNEIVGSIPGLGQFV
jgi:hypothetical protein